MKTMPYLAGACLLAGGAAAQAAPRTSANYSLVAEVADAGGRQATSANYTHDGSTAGVAGLSAVAAPLQTAKHGYVGQLYEVTGFIVNAAAPDVDEAATLQLGAWQLLDDATFLAVAPAAVSWAVVTGPITGISATGLASAGLVYQDTPATVQGTLGAATAPLNLTVRDTLPDNFGIYADDGITDSWQVQFFGLDSPLAGPAGNPDGDLHDNLFEFIAGLDPTDANSVFRLSIAAVPGQPGQKRLIFTPRLDDRTYAVKFRLELTAGEWLPLAASAFADAGDERTVTDLDASGPRRFYQVEITRP